MHETPVQGKSSPPRPILRSMSARLSRQHNDTNVMALGAGVVGGKLALEIVDLWLDTKAEGGRHARRVGKLMALDGQS